RSSLRGRQISRLVSCVHPLFFGHDLCPDRLSLPVPPIPGGWSWDRTAARWRCTRPHHAPASWTRWRHTAYDRLRPASRTGASSSVRFSVHRRPCCAPTPCCAPIQGLDIIFPENTEVICVPFPRQSACRPIATPEPTRAKWSSEPGSGCGLSHRHTSRSTVMSGAVIFTWGTSSRPQGSDCIIVETAWRMTGWPWSWDRRTEAVRHALPVDQRPGPGAGRAGEHDGGRGGGPRRAGPSALPGTPPLRHVYLQHRRRRGIRGRGPPAAGGSRAPDPAMRRALGDQQVSVTLGIDIGTSGTKTLAIDERGTILASASAEYPCSHPHPGWSEQDPELWWDATVQTLQAVLAAGAFTPADVKGIGLSGQMHGSVLLDETGSVIRPALLWNDQRTAAECREIEEKAGGRAALVKLVANPALTGFTAPKLLWVRNHEPANWDRVRQVLLPKDYVRYRLTGTFATEVSDASGTLLLDVVNRRWSRELLGKLEIDPALLPPCYESPEVSGMVSATGSKATGVRKGTPVVG